MNSLGKTRPTFTVLFEDINGLNSGDLTLSQPFTNFTYLMINQTNDSQSYRKLYIIPTWLLNYALSEMDRDYLLGDSANYWQIKTYAGGSTTTLLKIGGENSRMRGIYGFNLKV